jgi:hypothetical protein
MAESKANGPMKNMPEERYYLPKELAEEWGCSPELIRKVFRDEPGVLKFVIPVSVAVRVHQRILSTFHPESTEGNHNRNSNS